MRILSQIFREETEQDKLPNFSLELTDVHQTVLVATQETVKRPQRLFFNCNSASEMLLDTLALLIAR
jgi:hypothetical protein